MRAGVQRQWHAVTVVNDAPSAILRIIFSFILGNKTLSLRGGVLNGCVYDRISSVIKKALQCVWVSKRGRTNVVTVSTRSMTLTTLPTHDKTSASGTAKFHSYARRVEPSPSAVMYTRRVYWSNRKRDSRKLFVLCALDTSVPCVTYLLDCSFLSLATVVLLLLPDELLLQTCLFPT